MKVTYIDHMGTDLSVVNAARVSHNKQSNLEYLCVDCRKPANEPCDKPTCTYLYTTGISERDRHLIQFLSRGCTTGEWEELLDKMFMAYEREDVAEMVKHIRSMPTHWTPFGHTAITLHIKGPIFVARQLGKHQAGFVWNEVSRRYVDDEPEFFLPEYWRKRAESVKQGSSDEVVFHLAYGQDVQDEYNAFTDNAIDFYNQLLQAGVAPEQARMVLPQSMYTEWYWTGNLYGFYNVWKLRTDSHTQKETQEIAHQIGDIMRSLYPVSWEALTNGG